MKIYTIYKHPKDFSKHYVARVFQVEPNNSVASTEEFLVANTLDEARKFIPSDKVQINRDPLDDPVIVETWI